MVAPRAQGWRAVHLVIIQLLKLPALRGPKIWNGKLPTRMLAMHPDAARALIKLEAETGGLVYVGIFRTADAQLEAHRTKDGTKAVGYSGHGFGLSIDLDLKETMSVRGLRYIPLCEMLEHYGFYCHVRNLDGKRGESWHFNWLGTSQPETYLRLADPMDARTWDEPLEARIQELYGKQFLLSPMRVQQDLARLGFYGGEFDGDHGPLTISAIKAFQRAWGLVVDGRAGPVTQRVISFVCAERVIASV